MKIRFAMNLEAKKLGIKHITCVCRWLRNIRCLETSRENHQLIMVSRISWALCDPQMLTVILKTHRIGCLWWLWGGRLWPRFAKSFMKDHWSFIMATGTFGTLPSVLKFKSCMKKQHLLNTKDCIKARNAVVHYLKNPNGIIMTSMIFWWFSLLPCHWPWNRNCSRLLMGCWL